MVFKKSKEIPLEIQKISLYNSPLAQTIKSKIETHFDPFRHRLLVWEGLVRTPFNNVRVSIRYSSKFVKKYKRTLRVYLKISDLGYVLKDGMTSSLPHVYEIDRKNGYVELCLFQHNYEFNNRFKIGEFVVPWIVEWCHYFLVWEATGEWLGGGHSA